MALKGVVRGSKPRRTFSALALAQIRDVLPKDYEYMTGTFSSSMSGSTMTVKDREDGQTYRVSVDPIRGGA